MNASIKAVQDDEVYQQIGEEGFGRLVAAFYRQIPRDDVLGPIYPPNDWQAAEERLRDFLIYRFGGPPRYLETRGNPRLRMRHAPFAVDARARDRWLLLMKRALAEGSFSPEVQQVLHDYFESAATFMINRG